MTEPEITEDANPIAPELEKIAALGGDDETDREGVIRAHVRTEVQNAVLTFEAERDNGDPAPAVFLDDVAAVIAHWAVNL